MKTLLLAEDEQVLGRLVKEALERRSYKVLWAKDGQEALDLFQEKQPDLCILDVMMPSLNGFVLARKIRNVSNNVPILFLTARSETQDVVKGFEVGGNDYLKKPFSLEELFLRVKELLTRTHHFPAPTEVNKESYSVGSYCFNPVAQVLKNDEESITLSNRETQLLMALLQHKNNLLSRKEALQEIWGSDSFFNSRSMDVYISKLRKYLRRDPTVSILNIRGYGFKLIEDADQG